MTRMTLGYPTAEDEARILTARPDHQSARETKAVLSIEQLVALQKQVDAVTIDESLVAYIVTFAQRTRDDQRFRIGLSPRGSLALAQMARATALVAGRTFVTPDDVISNIPATCAHRIMLADAHGPEHRADRVADVLLDILTTIPVPK